jgi:hypothetical protein
MVTLTTAACGGSAAPAVTITATQTVATPAESTPPASTPATESTSAPAEASTPAAPPTVAAAKIKVPNGVGKDYQTAQDLWRAAGLHVAPATDATGAHRLPIIDSNWVVLSQDLKAGSSVPSDSFITATVKKYTDS